MLKTRVIPSLLWKGPGLVKGIGFDSWRRVGTVMPAIKVYNTRDVDELVLLDIEATAADREPDFESLEEYAAECFVPLTVGGGVRTLEHIRRLLLAGADKVCINTAAYSDPELIREASKRFGAQCIVIGIDCKKMPDGAHRCFSHSGTRDTGLEAAEWARRVESFAAGEILLTSIERDGTQEGYDLELIRKVTSNVSIPVIASGGAGSYEHLAAAVKTAGASAVAAASMFHFTERTPLEAKKFMHDHGIPTRLYKMEQTS
jgi:cyclase